MAFAYIHPGIATKVGCVDLSISEIYITLALLDHFATLSNCILRYRLTSLLPEHRIARAPAAPRGVSVRGVCLGGGLARPLFCWRSPQWRVGGVVAGRYAWGGCGLPCNWAQTLSRAPAAPRGVSVRGVCLGGGLARPLFCWRSPQWRVGGVVAGRYAWGGCGFPCIGHRHCPVPPRPPAGCLSVGSVSGEAWRAHYFAGALPNGGLGAWWRAFTRGEGAACLALGTDTVPCPRSPPRGVCPWGLSRGRPGAPMGWRRGGGTLRTATRAGVEVCCLIVAERIFVDVTK